MGQAKFVASILFIAIFTLAIVSYVTIFAAENNAGTNLGNSNSFATVNTSLRSDMSLFVVDVNESSEGFTRSSIETGSETLKSPSVFQNLKFATDSISTVLHLLRYEVFGNNPSFMIVLSVISGFIALLAFLYIWKTLKGGDPD